MRNSFKLGLIFPMRSKSVKGKSWEEGIFFQFAHLLQLQPIKSLISLGIEIQVGHL